MNLLVKNTTEINGKVTPPASKSQSIRAIILASLCEGKSVLHNVLHSDDIQDAIRVCQSLGATITQSGNTLTIYNTGLPLDISSNTIESGNSGITTHFVMPLLGLRKNPDTAITLNCNEQMRARPIKSLADSLENLGLAFDYLNNPGTLPVRISGELRGGKSSVNGVTSQYLSALLVALPCAKQDSEITVNNLQERSYADMTLDWLKEQHIQFDHQINGETDTFQIRGGQCYRPFETTIAADFSSASYLIAAATLFSGEVIINDINMSDRQGDKELVYILQKMGADIAIHPTHLHIRGGKKLSGIKIDAIDIPDLLPTLAVIGTFASGKTEICNVAHARIKETDRIHSMTDGLTRMGAKIIEQTDGLIIYESHLQGTHVKGYGDHRTVMALSLAGMLAAGTTTIDDCEAIKKTFPNFVTLMQSIGACMEVKK